MLQHAKPVPGPRRSPVKSNLSIAMMLMMQNWRKRMPRSHRLKTKHFSVAQFFQSFSNDLQTITAYDTSAEITAVYYHLQSRRLPA
jgi:hypothetical protein